jgi:hypothetical protein
MDRGRVSLAERSSFVIEAGTVYTRIGVAGENAPRRVFNTPKFFQKWFSIKSNSEVVI